MFLRVNDGLYAGEIREFPPHVGRELPAQGRAVNPFNRIEDARDDRTAAERAPKAEAENPQTRRKGRR